MLDPKPISRDSIPGALARAERYRLLNEPSEAESICLDILAIDPQNEQALISLVLALTDQFAGNSGTWRSAMDAAARLPTEYDRLYYEGIAWERRAKARFHSGGPGACEHVYNWLVRAQELYERAERLRPSGNDDAVLRWNACARFLNARKELVPSEEHAPDPILSE